MPKKKTKPEAGSLTAVVSDIACKCFGALQVGFGGLDKLTFPVKYAAIESDEPKEVVFC